MGNLEVGEVVSNYVAFTNWEVNAYRANYTDLENAFGDNLKQYYIHFSIFGFGEGRVGI